MHAAVCTVKLSKLWIIKPLDYGHTTEYKKFELMLSRRVKTYSSSCSQTVSPAISSQFILGVCTAAEDRKNQ